MPTLANAQSIVNAQITGAGLTPDPVLTAQMVCAGHISRILGGINGTLNAGAGGLGATMPGGTISYADQIRIINGAINTPIDARWRDATMKMLAMTNPLPSTAVSHLRADISRMRGAHQGAILRDMSLILAFACMERDIGEREQNLPTAPTGIATPITAAPATINGIRTIGGGGTSPAERQKVEIRDRSGNVLGEAPAGSLGSTSNFSIPNLTLPNGFQNLIIRCTNEDTNVYSDTPFTVNVNIPEAPKAPEGPESIGSEVLGNVDNRGILTGKLKHRGHRVTNFLDENGGPLPAGFVLARDVTTNPDGTFSITMPALSSWATPRSHGEHKFRMVITNNATPSVDHTEVVTIRYSETPLSTPTTPRIIIPNHAAHIGGAVIEKDEHHSHIHLENPIAGSRVTVSGQGLPSPVTINVSPDMIVTPAAPAAPYLNIELPNFDTHTSGRKNMTIAQEDPNYPDNKRTDNFDITVNEDPHHVPDNRKISEAAFMAGAVRGYYTLPGDIDPMTHAPVQYRIGRGVTNGGRLMARVPVLPGEEKWFGRETYVHSFTRKGLYAEVRKHLERCNSLAKAMNSTEHVEDASHDQNKHNKESGEKTAEGKEKGEKEKGDHKDDKGHDDHKDEGGTKYDKVVNKIFGNGIIGKTFKGVRNLIPKGVRGLTGAAFDGAVASTVIGGGLYLTSAAIGSAALSSLIVPAMTLSFAGYGIYSAAKRFNKWRASRGGGESKGGGH